ncbi:MAG: hypothetical protein NC489_45745 [Ruminococcus flavefaciens]|nr:hypothetical protein [Ruminococcus flavefaciens]
MIAMFEDPDDMELGKKYKGEIRRYTLDEMHRIFCVYITIDELGHDFEYVKKFEYNLNLNSELGMFCNNMMIMPDHQFVDFDDLLGEKVVVTMGKNAKGILYVSEVYMDDEFYDKQFEKEDDNCGEE